MIFFKSFALLITVAAALATSPNRCNGNNCDRAVAGTAKGTAVLEAHRTACSTNLACTATPAASATTITQHFKDGGSCSSTTSLGARPSAITTCNDKIDESVKDACQGKFERYQAACLNCASITVPTGTADAPLVTDIVKKYNCPCPTGGTCPGGVGAFSVCGPDCLCFTGFGLGNTFCGLNFDPPCSSKTTCTSNADCPAGSACAYDTCCVGPVCAQVCPNGA